MSVNYTRYALWFLGTGLATTIIVLLVQRVFGITIGAAFGPIIPAMVASLVEGAKYARDNPAPLPEPWKAAAALTGLATVLTAFLIVGAALTASGESAFSFAGFGLVIVIYVVFFLITNRIFLAMGARNVWMAQGGDGS